MKSLEWVQRFVLLRTGSDFAAEARRCERGATAIEYALIAALLAVMAIGGLKSFASGVGDMYARISTAFGHAG